MTYQEKKSIVNIFSTILVFSVYYWRAFEEYAATSMSFDEELQFWGKTILLIIPISIGIKIVLHILFVILNTIITREKHPGIEDERDRLIDLKSTRNAFYQHSG